MAETIQALSPIAFSRPRLQKRERDDHADFKFAHWLSDQEMANDMPPINSMPVPMMSPEDILILAQAEEEEFTMAAKVYSDMAEKVEAPRDENQMAFEFMLLERTVSEDI
jgi:hypothetical protein